jgi:hypothetical protein
MPHLHATCALGSQEHRVVAKAQQLCWAAGWNWSWYIPPPAAAGLCLGGVYKQANGKYKIQATSNYQKYST